MRGAWGSAFLTWSLFVSTPLFASDDGVTSAPRDVDGRSAATDVDVTSAAHDVDVTSVARVFLDEIGEGRYLLSVVDTKVPPITDPRGVVPMRCAPVAVEDVEILVASGFVFECESPLNSGDVLTLPWSLAATGPPGRATSVAVVAPSRWLWATCASTEDRACGWPEPT